MFREIHDSGYYYCRDKDQTQSEDVHITVLQSCELNQFNCTSKNSSSSSSPNYQSRDSNTTQNRSFNVNVILSVIGHDIDVASLSTNTNISIGNGTNNDNHDNGGGAENVQHSRQIGKRRLIKIDENWTEDDYYDDESSTVIDDEDDGEYYSTTIGVGGVVTALIGLNVNASEINNKTINGSLTNVDDYYDDYYGLCTNPSMLLFFY